MEKQDTQRQPMSGTIDFSLGHPSDELLPLAEVRQMASKVLAEADPSLLQYGMEQGNPAFREALAAFLSAEQGGSVEPDFLFTTSGASQALDLICTLLTKPGDTVLVEEPTYFLAFRIFASHGLKIKSVATDEEGLIIEDLEKILEDAKPAFLYTIPTYQNPTGAILPEARRKRLVELSREHKLLVVADEVYHLLNYGSPPPRPLASYVSEGHILSVNSFSKILGPGLRLGWMQAAPKHIETFTTSGLLNSGGGLSPLTSAVIGEGLKSGFQKKHLTHLRNTFKERIDAMTAALHHYLPEAVFAEPVGGYFYWLHLPGIDATKLSRIAAANQVGFQPGPTFSNHQSLNEFLRLSFAFYETPVLVEGVKRLARSVEEMNALNAS